VTIDRWLDRQRAFSALFLRPLCWPQRAVAVARLILYRAKISFGGKDVD
jgi:hypothetical protein